MPTNSTWWGPDQPTQDSFAQFGTPGTAAYQTYQPTQLGYTPPAPAAQGNGMKEQAMAGSDWIQAAQLIYQAYKDKNPEKPKFANQPLSPEQKELYDLYLKSLMNPATKDNAAYVNNIAQQQLQGLSGMKWTSPKTFSGDQGYSGSNTSFTPPWKPGVAAPTSPTRPTPPDGGAWKINDMPTLTQPQRAALTLDINQEVKDMHNDYDVEAPRFDSGGTFSNEMPAFNTRRSSLDDEVTPLWRDSTSLLGNPTQEQLAEIVGRNSDGSVRPESWSPWWSRLDDAWDNFRREHPNWARAGQAAVGWLAGAAGGAPGALVSRYIFKKLNQDDGSQPNP